MSEELDLGNVAVTVMWLLNSIKDESTKNYAELQRVCRLDDFTEFEMYELRQARDGEDRV